MNRRHLLQRLSMAASALAAATSAVQAQTPSAAVALPAMTEGPFYPPAAWRAAWTDWDADLTRVSDRSDGAVSQGELLGLETQVVDSRGRAIDRAEVEIWQCDALAAYHHPRVNLVPGRHDPAFAGFGATRSQGDGLARFRTIRPVPYPGRTPHIHVKLRHPSFGELTSQLFVSADPGNAGDFIWRRLSGPEREAVQFSLTPAPAGTDLRWLARSRLVVPA